MSTRKFPASFEHLDEIRGFVGDAARQAGFTEKTVYSIQLAADEAASNIIEHAYAGHSDRSFQLRCDLAHDRLILTFYDQGSSFDFSKVDAPDIAADLADRKIGGLGIFLMHKLMDHVDYRVTSSGNFLRLVKRKE
jgi:serine/threonine-protein kinase RsbW